MIGKIVRVRLEVPDNIPSEVHEEALRQAHEAAVLSLWDAGELSASSSAQELGLSAHDFLDLLARKGLPVERGPLNLEAIEASRRKLAGDTWAKQ